MSLYARLGLNFDTSQFGSAANLSSNASNTLNLIAGTSGALPQWQQTDLSAGPPVRTNYFKNPTTIYLTEIANASLNIQNTAYLVGTANTANAANNLITEITLFQSHTDNISGVVAVSNTFFPSLQSAQNLGQLNMMTLAKSDGVSNTAPILGSFTSLFVTSQLANTANLLIYYANEYASSVLNVSGSLVSTLSNAEIANIQTTLANTQSLMYTRRNSDWTFYQNSLQLAQDVGFMQQFSNMGGTMTYLVNNYVGTPRLLANLSSSGS